MHAEKKVKWIFVCETKASLKDDFSKLEAVTNHLYCLRVAKWTTQDWRKIHKPSSCCLLNSSISSKRTWSDCRCFRGILRISYLGSNVLQLFFLYLVCQSIHEIKIESQETPPFELPRNFQRFGELLSSCISRRGTLFVKSDEQCRVHCKPKALPLGLANSWVFVRQEK